MSLVNDIFSLSNHGMNHKNITQILDYQPYRQKSAPRNLEKMERNNTTYANLPTICENSHCNSGNQPEKMNVLERRWSNALPANGSSLPPLSKESNHRKLKHSNSLPNLVRRPSTPRPVFLVQSNQKFLSDNLDVRKHNAVENGKNSNNILQISKIHDENDWHPLLSVSPDGLERSSTDVEIARGSCVQLQQPNAFQDPSMKRLLKRDKVQPCERRLFSARRW